MSLLPPEPISIPLKTQNARVLYHAGMICFLSGQVEAARDFLQRALADPFSLTEHEVAEVFDALAQTEYFQ